MVLLIFLTIVSQSESVESVGNEEIQGNRGKSMIFFCSSVTRLFFCEDHVVSICIDSLCKLTLYPLEIF